MSQISGQPILDYASPSARSPLRLVEKSVIAFEPTATGVNIVESLVGKRDAIFAIFFSGGMMTLLGSILIAMNGPRLDLTWINSWNIFYLIFLTITIVTIIAVIKTNWRKTILEITPGNLVLIFKEPFKRSRHHWTAEQIHQALVVQELDARTHRIVYEVQIEFWTHPMARLFTGHDPPELGQIAERIHQYIPPVEKPAGKSPK